MPHSTSPVARSLAVVLRTMDAVHNALEAELASDDCVFVAGIDVAAGGNFCGLIPQRRLGQLAARHEWRRHADPVSLATMSTSVKVHRCCADTYVHLAGTDVRRRELIDPHHLGRAVRLTDGGPHVNGPLSSVLL